MNFDLLFHDISWESQKMFLQQTLGHPLLLAKPISWSYQAAFLRVAIETLEKNTPEVHEDFYTEYLRLQQLASLEQTHVYKHYRVPQSDKLISVRESPKLFCDGTTGLRTWASSIALCEWFVHNLTDLSQKTLLELGAGVGMAGIMLGQMVENCNIHLTDFHEKVLGILEENVCANPPANSNNLIVSQLDWNSEADYERLSKTCCPDVVYAADVIYDSDLFPALCRLILLETVE
ncbi:protein-lysine N-methyltransferase EEF2KMT [Phlebotomus argentipes]|uniref:protein-lysine N-methyltransferase EEF2KMT n=1 Tax=Phlebotomus argentipes TaxID=94469 RepID=UPI0028934B74|nr:protein-lysine N-methyltransferase EEF2KMT [Phlebotomus argentipes]